MISRWFSSPELGLEVEDIALMIALVSISIENLGNPK